MGKVKYETLDKSDYVLLDGEKYQQIFVNLMVGDVIFIMSAPLAFKDSSLDVELEVILGCEKRDKSD